MQTKHFFAATLFFISMSATAQKASETVTVNNNNSPDLSSFLVTVTPTEVGFSLWIQNPDKKKLQVEIRHQYSGTVVDTVVYTDSFSQRYNMNEAEDGKYVVIVSAGKKKVSKEFELNTITTRSVVIQ